MPPFRFGVVCTGQYDARAWPALARKVEDLGFATLLVADHYVNPMACWGLSYTVCFDEDIAAMAPVVEVLAGA